MNKSRISILIGGIVAILFLMSCSRTQVIVLPNGNLNKENKTMITNTDQDEVSPQIEDNTTKFEFNCEAVLREPAISNPATNNQQVTVFPASKIVKEKLLPLIPTLNVQAYDNLTENVESVFFVNGENGFASFAFSPSFNYNELNKLPFELDNFSSVGGVDIYEFNWDRVRSRYIFKRMKEPINSPFWDSNPVVITDTSNGICNQVLIWSSDRESPFRYIEKLDKTRTYNLNKDLYYSFRVNYGDWSEPKKFDEGDINTNFNEVTPFVYCSCCNPVLFFASNRGYGENQSYDIYYAKLKIDFTNQFIKVVQPAKLVTPVGSIEKNKMFSSINSPWDERFPYVPTTYNKQSFENYIYFTSNRYDKDSNIKYKIGKDTIILNEGGYDLYRFRLPQNPDFDCIVPDPPVYDIFLKVKVNLKIYDEKGNLIEVQTNIPNLDYSLHGVEINSKNDEVNFYQILDIYNNEITLPKERTNQTLCLYNQETKGVQITTNGVKQYTNHFSCDIYKTQFVYRLKKSHKYLIKVLPQLDVCESGDCTEHIIITPDKLFRNDTIELTLDCFKITKPPQIVPRESYKNGIAFFVTGYWWPTTTKNLATLKSRLESGCLNTSRFIDITDYKPDHRDYYIAAAETNDKFFEQELCPRLEAMLDKIDKCHYKQKILITIHSFTDPCPLRTIRDESGQIIQDYTLYSCDPEIEYNDLIISPGIKMKQPEIKRKDGSLYKSNLGVQQGNVVLAMLRSYYTKETIINEFKEYARKKGLNYPIEKMIDFKLDAFGIFEEATKNCLGRFQFWGSDLPNTKYPEDDEFCNVPFSRRTMIYVELVNIGEEKYFIRNECGQIINPLPPVIAQEKKKKQKVEPSKIEFDTEIKKIDKWKEHEENYQKSIEYPCVGTPCEFLIQYGVAQNEEQYKTMLSLLHSIGIKDVTRNVAIQDKWVLVSNKTRNRELLEKQLEEYRSLIEDKLKGLFKEFEISAEIIIVQ